MPAYREPWWPEKSLLFRGCGQHGIHDLLPDRVIVSCEAVRRIHLTGEKIVWVEELQAGFGAHFVDRGWLLSSRHMRACTGLRETL